MCHLDNTRTYKDPKALELSVVNENKFFGLISIFMCYWAIPHAQ